jgi:exopolysaccharide biosynthesis polyprenyl glycosylphosphotransferase
MANREQRVGGQRRHRDVLTAAYVVTDILAVVAAYIIALYLRVESAAGERFFTAVNTFFGFRQTGALDALFTDFYLRSAPRILFFLLATLLPLYAYFDLYAGRRLLRGSRPALGLVKANLIALLLFFAFFYLSRNQFHPRSMFLTVVSLNVILALFFRTVARARFERLHERSGLGSCPALLLGDGKAADWLAAFLNATRPHGVHVVAQFPLDAGEPVEAVLLRIEEGCAAHGAGMVICAEPGLGMQTVTRILERTESLGLPVKILSEEMRVLMHEARLPIDTVLNVPMAHFDVPPAPWRLSLGRAVSAAASTAALLVASPFMGLLAVWIRLTSPGPALFVQERIGVNQHPFRMLKFRTMHNRAEEMRAALEEFNETASRGLFKIRRDPRVTPVGRFLRRFSLDELPQLWNVVRGEMNLVGPRPLPRSDFENYYESWHYGRHAGLPGLTCLWQVSGRSDLTFHDMCILDLYYLRNQNAVLNVRILLRTLGVVLFAKGAY